MCANAGQAGMSFYPEWPYKMTYGRRGILSSTLISPGTYVRWLKIDFISYASSCRRPVAVELYDICSNRRRTVAVDNLH